ncbi:MAG: metallophosphoesterase [Planctomycetaceae bacterium]|nr:metallophosphoesterase [Planctomycetaceae bacterium]
MQTLIIAMTLLATPASPAQTPQPHDLLAGASWKGTQASFTVADPQAYAGLLTTAAASINGKAVGPLLEGMAYESYPADAAMLVKGANVITFRPGKGARGAALKLLAYTPQMLAVDSGPMLGAISSDFFTVTCRTNCPAAVTVTARPVDPSGGKETSASSPRGYYHRLKIPLAPGVKSFAYTLKLTSPAATKTEGPYTVRVPGVGGGPLRIAAAGDSRSHPQAWGGVAAAIAAAKPDLVVLTGDYVHYGQIDSAWDSQFFGPAKEMLATVPTYGVLGNHDQSATVFFQMFYGPTGQGNTRNWSQQFGDVLLIGIDGGPRGASAKWLPPVLEANTTARFIFLANHYPAYSSGPHGDEKGLVTNSRNLIMPLLVNAGATAMIAGHDHDYERSEPPGGVACIVTGGGGAPLYKIDPKAAAKNPHSKFFSGVYNYCIFEIDGDSCTLKAYDLEGKLLDQATYKGRAAAAKKAG